MKDICITISFEINEFDKDKVKEIIKQIIDLNIEKLEIKEV